MIILLFFVGIQKKKLYILHIHTQKKCVCVREYLFTYMRRLESNMPNYFQKIPLGYFEEVLSRSTFHNKVLLKFVLTHISCVAGKRKKEKKDPLKYFIYSPSLSTILNQLCRLTVTHA